MIYEVENLNGSIVNLKNPISVEINMDEDAPADSIKAKFPIDLNSEEYKTFANDQLTKIRVYDDEKSRVILNGIIDEQIVSIDNNGVSLTILARSTAALLLDNEAKPQVYNSINMEILYNRHIRPYGFLNYNNINIENKTFNGLFEVNKGYSEWQVIENFCDDYLLKKPRVRASNTIDFLDSCKDSGIIFSNKNKESVYYSSLEQNYKRFNLVSEVFIRSLRDGNYDNRILDQDLINKDIKRRRYINAVGDTKSPEFRGKQLIEASKINSFELKLTHPGPIVIDLFDKATIDDQVLGVIPNLIASSITYKLSRLGETCTITFRKE